MMMMMMEHQKFRCRCLGKRLGYRQLTRMGNRGILFVSVSLAVIPPLGNSFLHTLTIIIMDEISRVKAVISQLFWFRLERLDM